MLVARVTRDGYSYDPAALCTLHQQALDSPGVHWGDARESKDACRHQVSF